METAPQEMYESSELRETVGVLLQRKLIVIVTTVALTVVAVAMSMRQTPMYASSASVVIRPVIAPAAFQNSGYSLTGPLGLDTSPDSEAEIARSAVVADQVRKALNLTATEELPGTVGVKVLTDQLLGFTGVSTVPQEAARLANVFAREYLSYRRNTAEAALRDLANSLKTRVDTLQKSLGKIDARIVTLTAMAGDPARRAQAIAQINQLQSQRNEQLFQMSAVRTRYEDAEGSLGRSTGGGEIVQPAAVPTGPASPKPMRDGALGFILGAILGIGLAFVRQHFDDKIRDLSDASRKVGLLVLGVIPRSKKWRKKDEVRLETITEPSSPVTESYRSLRQGLAKMGLGADSKTLLITSLGAEAGKSTSAANLGVAFARTGKRVVLISADLRRPRLHEFFDLRNEAGLSEVLGGRMTLETIAPTKVPNLWVLPSGAVPHNPAELLDGERLADVLRRVEAAADVVIIDGPPMAAGADAVVLARHAGSTLMLLPEQRARARGAVSAMQELTRGGARRIVAAITLASEGLAGKKYGYGYGYGSYEAKEPASNGNGNGHANGNGNGHSNGHANGNGHIEGGLQVATPVMVRAVYEPEEQAVVPATRAKRAARPAAAKATTNGNGNGNGAKEAANGNGTTTTATRTPRAPRATKKD